MIFVEVKTRSSGQWGHPELAVSERKQHLIFKAADSYLYEKQMSTVPVRFDIIAITFEQAEHPLIHHIEDAFRMFQGPARASLWQRGQAGIRNKETGKIFLSLKI